MWKRDPSLAQSSLERAGISNSYQGNLDQLSEIQTNRIEPGQRDENAGIQYYTPKSGVNCKTMIQPIIAPRILDQDVWGQSSTVRSNINNQTYRDITLSSLDVDDLKQGQTTSHSLGVPPLYQPRVYPKLTPQPQNQVGENTDHGWYNSGEFAQYNGLNRLDFNSEILPLYSSNEKKENNFPAPTVKMVEETNDEELGLSRQYDSLVSRTSQDPNQVQQEMFQNRMAYLKKTGQLNGSSSSSIGSEQQNRTEYYQRKYGPQYQQQATKTREGFSYREPDVGAQDQSATSNGEFQPEIALQNEFRNRGANIVPSNQYYGSMNRVPPGKDVQVTPVTEQLLQASPTYILTDKYFDQPDAKLFLQDVQPKLYSYTVDPQPINSNIGITYAPQEPPRVLDQITDGNMAYPLYTRIDPQLVRKDGTPGQRANNPVRTNWSAEYSDFQAPEGSINFEDIYDPRFNSYGDPYRSYSDINLGQVQYYYSDVDAYRRPNFITRTNVDFIDFRDPMGRVKPFYPRTASLDEVRAQVENERTADELFHRQDIMSSQMAKRNSEMYQLRQAPLRKTANSNMSWGPN